VFPNRILPLSTAGFYDVVYYPEGGTGATFQPHSYYNSAKNTPMPVLYKAGYIFDG
jgi:hypothetical protein